MPGQGGGEGQRAGGNGGNWSFSDILKHLGTFGTVIEAILSALGINMPDAASNSGNLLAGTGAENLNKDQLEKLQELLTKKDDWTAEDQKALSQLLGGDKLKDPQKRAELLEMIKQQPTEMSEEDKKKLFEEYVKPRVPQDQQPAIADAMGLKMPIDAVTNNPATPTALLPQEPAPTALTPSDRPPIPEVSRETETPEQHKDNEAEKKQQEMQKMQTAMRIMQQHGSRS